MTHIQKARRVVTDLEVLQYMGTEESADKLAEWVQYHDEEMWNVTQTRDRHNNKVRVQTKTCDITANPLDWIVRQEDGRFRSYPPHEFGTIFTINS